MNEGMILVASPPKDLNAPSQNTLEQEWLARVAVLEDPTGPDRDRLTTGLILDSKSPLLLAAARPSDVQWGRRSRG